MTKPWPTHRQEITELYIHEGLRLEDVRSIMKQRYGFEASVRAYRHHFDRWGLAKYNRRTRPRRPAARSVGAAAIRAAAGTTTAITPTTRRPLPTSPTLSLSSATTLQSSSPPASAVGSSASTSTDSSNTMRNFLGDDVVAADTDSAFSPPHTWTVTGPLTPSPPGSPSQGIVLGELGDPNGEHADDLFHTWGFEQKHPVACHVQEWAAMPYASRPRLFPSIEQDRRYGLAPTDMSYEEPLHGGGQFGHGVWTWPSYSSCVGVSQ